MKAGMIGLIAMSVVCLMLSTVNAETLDLELQMPGTIFLTGAPCSLNLAIFNPGSEVANAFAFVMLNLGTEDFWFFPSWKHYPPNIDWNSMNIPGFTRSELIILPEFDWPAGTGEFFNAGFYAAVLSDRAELISDIPVFHFGWTSNPIADAVYPESGPPGKLLKLAGRGFNLPSGNLKIRIGDIVIPAVSSGVNEDGSEYAITVIPPLPSGSYGIAVVSVDLESNSLPLFIEEMAPTGYPPGQIITHLSAGMNTLFSEIRTNVIADAVSSGLIPSEARIDYESTVDRAGTIFNVFCWELAAMPEDDIALIESVLVQNGLDDLFTGLAEKSGFPNGRGNIAGGYACISLDATSACLTAIDQVWSLVDLATIVATILSGGAGLPAAGGSFGMHFAIMIIDATFDGFFPIDLKIIKLEGVEGVLPVILDQETRCNIQGEFDNQTTPSSATFGILLNTFLEGLGPFLPQTIDDQFRNWIIGKLANFGMNLGEGILGPDIMNWGDPPPETYYIDFNFYEDVDLNEILAMTMFSQSSIIKLMNQLNMGVFPETGIVPGNQDCIDFEVNQEKITITGKQSGTTSLTFKAFAFSVSDSWWNILNLEIPESVVKIQEVQISSPTEPSPTPPPSATATPHGPTATPTLPGPSPTPPPGPDDLVYLPPGTFQMGSPEGELCRYSDESPLHTVILTQGFYIQQTEVTQQQWIEIFGSNPSYFVGLNRPVEQVTWYDACIFCNRLSMAGGLTPCYYSDEAHSTVLDGTPPVTAGTVYWDRDTNGYRLPTEAEWEYACRAGTTAPYNNGQVNTSCIEDPNLNPLCWYKYTSDTGNGRETHDVGLKQANVFTLYDMHGNVDEWCWDVYDYNYYQTSPGTDPTGPAYQGLNRVVRGGAWSRNAASCRSAQRNDSTAGIRSSLTGFRIVN